MTTYDSPKYNMAHDDIMVVLQDKALTPNEIIDSTGLPRSTVYASLAEMVGLGLIRNITPARRRGAKYALGDGRDSANVIPEFFYKKSSYKAQYFLKNNESLVTEPYEDLFLSLARIFATAERLYNGGDVTQAELVLRRARVKIIEARATFRNLSELADQILQHPSIWNPIYLNKYPEDNTWDNRHHNDFLNAHGLDSTTTTEEDNN